MENKDKRTAIIDSTVRVVAKHGFHGASMSMIAEHAGVAAGTIYLHFESKDHLMREAYKELEQRCIVTIMENYPLDGLIQQRFSHMCHELIICPVL